VKARPTPPRNEHYLAIESSLPPIPLLVSQRQRLAAVMRVCFPSQCQPGDSTPTPLLPHPLLIPSPGRLKSPHEGPFVSLPPPELEDPPPLPPSSEPPLDSRSGPQNYRFHWHPVQDDHDKCTPGPRILTQPPPAIPDGERVLCLEEEGEGGAH